MLYSPLTCEWWEKQDDRRNAKVVSGNVIKMFATVPWNIWRGHFIPQQQKFTEGGMYIWRLLKFQVFLLPLSLSVPNSHNLPSFLWSDFGQTPLPPSVQTSFVHAPKCKLLTAQRTIILLSSLSSKLGQPLYYLRFIYCYGMYVRFFWNRDIVQYCSRSLYCF